MQTKVKPANEWLAGGAGSILKVCDMLVELDRRNLIPNDMRAALVSHAEELVSVLPNYIAANANLMATAHAEKLLAGEDDEAAQVCWGVAFMTDSLNGMQSLARLERDRHEFPAIHEAVSRAYGAGVSLVTGEGQSARG